MMIDESLWFEIGINFLAIFIVATACVSRNWGRFLYSLLYIWGALINWKVAHTSPLEFLNFADFTLSESYRNYILGSFAHSIVPIITVVVGIQLLIGILLLTCGKPFKFAAFFSTLFFLLLIPLGSRADFLCTSIFALGSGLLFESNFDEPLPMIWVYSLRSFSLKLPRLKSHKHLHS